MRNTSKLCHLVALALCAIAQAGVHAATPYVMRDLGILSPAGLPYTDYMNSVAFAINESGVVAGDSGMQYGEQPTTPFLYANGMLSSLSRNPNPWASDNIVVADINNLGQVVGGIGFTLLYQNGSWVSISGSVTPTAVNDQGEIVGHANGMAKYFADGGWHEFTFHRPDDTLYVPGWSYATAITNQGLIVGYAQLGGVSKIFNANLNGVANFAMYSQGYEDFCNWQNPVSCFAHDVNGNTEGLLGLAVAGYGGNGNALVDDVGGYTSILGVGQARAINGQGQIVGWMQVAGQDHAFLWDNGELIDLGTFGGSQSRAYDINDTGQIVGWAMLPGDTAYHAFLAEPVPEPETWATLLAGLGLLGFRLRRRVGR